MIGRFFLLLNWLSLDTAIGAVIGIWFCNRLLANVELGYSTYISTFCIVISVYAADHLLDSRTITLESESSRRTFYRRYATQYWIVFFCSIIASVWFISLLPVQSIGFGFICGLALLMYMLFVHISSFKSAVAKELLLATIYAAVITAIPNYMVLATCKGSILWFLYFLIALMNIIILHKREQPDDLANKASNLFNYLGYKLTLGLFIVIAIILVTVNLMCLFSGALGMIGPTVFIAMTVANCFIFRIDKSASLLKYHRVMAEMVFWLPLSLYWLKG